MKNSPVPPKDRTEKEKKRPNMLMNPLWVTARTTQVTNGTHRTNQRGTFGSTKTSPASSSAQPRVNRHAGR